MLQTDDILSTTAALAPILHHFLPRCPAYIQDSMLGQTREEWVNRYDAVQDNLLGISMHRRLVSIIAANLSRIITA
ncbi:uncharacterized protein ARMOST_18237 [Armillaria ostoyae]|uniref:Uncharacterized protein n=1 Tax=Armillaria ostoyae TaxID=47428 RepID=A0A284S1A4_ARMOS|nr:uncharacterized protein ARMOST_18237 [Armillaria ostoyae]